MNDLYSLHVMPLLPGHEAELAADAEMLIRENICSKIACMMTLVPEGNPPDDKAAVLGQRFDAFRKAFHGDPSKVGILIQASIGHGWTPDEPCGFRRIMCADGSEPYQMCPFGDEFLAYLDRQVSTLAALKPGFFMVDDDFRLITIRNGCWCPLHIGALNRRTGGNYTRESLFEALRDNPALADDFDAVQLESLIGAAKVIRAAIDRHAPGIECSFCTCSHDAHHANAIQDVLAGSTGKKLIRINNGRYLCDGMRGFPRRMYDAAVQIAALDPGTTVLAETDTCPQNRWSTAATLLHAHFCGSILEGCGGAKHWITRTALWEPREGTAYRRILKENSGFYTELFRTLQNAAPAPFAAAVLPGRRRNSNFLEYKAVGAARPWSSVTSLMGIPSMFVKDPSIPSMLSGEEAAFLTESQLENIARRGLVLNGEAAAELTRRGLSRFSGVEAVPWDGPRVSCEFTDGGELIGASSSYARITPLGQARAYGKLVHRRSGTDTAYTELGPSVFYTENCFGARVAVFAASYSTAEAFGAFSFLNLQRKQEIVDALEYVTGGRIAYVTGDSEIYVKQYSLPGGQTLFAFISLTFDPLDSIPLKLPRVPVSAEYLTPDGKWAAVPIGESGIALPLPAGGVAAIRVSM